MLIAESHFTDKSHLKIYGYNVYSTEHPDGRAHGGTAILIKKTIKHHELRPFNEDYLQATTIVVEDRKIGPTALAAVYCPPRHNIKYNKFEEFLQRLGPRFLAGGDYNAKHQAWGSRLTTTRGRELLKAMAINNCTHLSPNQPTYWPTDRNKIPDVLDFFIAKGIASIYTRVEASLDLSSDHIPVLLTLSSEVLNKEKPLSLYTRKTNWTTFKETINDKVDLKTPLKNGTDVDDATEQFTRLIQRTAWESTPTTTTMDSHVAVMPPDEIQRKIATKRRARRQWQLSRNILDKNKFNRETRELKKLIMQHNNSSFETYLSQLTNTVSTEYSLWKATKKNQHDAKLQSPNKKIGRRMGTE